MRRAIGFLPGLSFLTAVLALLWVESGAVAAEPKPVMPQPAASELSPGLSVLYYFHFFRHVDEIVEWKDYKDGKAGRPILRLDNNVGQGNVLTSGVDEGVGAEISGLINLSQPGSYAFTVQSNDGFRLEIGGVPLLEDPDVHADRYSDVAQLEVTEPGWYPISLLYFERKNTSTLELYWQPPGNQASTMPLVPAEVLAHLKAD